MSTGSGANSASPAASMDSGSADRRKEKKAIRGSRQVKKLSAEQLARKRAHDREAQRNSRKRTIEHIDRLEKTVGDHVDYNQQLLVRNEQLELRLARLEAQLNKTPFEATGTGRRQENDGTTSTMPMKAAYEGDVGEQPGTVWEASSQVSSMGLHAPIYIPGNPQPPSALGMSEFDLGASGSIYIQSPQTSFEGSAYNLMPKTEFGGNYATDYYEQDSLGNPGPMASGFYITDSTAQSSSLAPTYSDGGLSNPPAEFVSNCWQRQPSIYAWQLSTKLNNPDNPTDQLILSIVQVQRHHARTTNACGEDLVGPKSPSLNALFRRGVPEVSHPLVTALTAGMHQLADFVTKTPNKICGLLATYRLYQWMIEPTQETYSRLFEWQAPRPCQLLISHPAWMDHPPWGKFRDKIIENQDLYGNLEFQLTYISNMTVNWPYSEVDMFCLNEDGQLRPSPLMEKHLGHIENLVMMKPFLVKYPEFTDLCRVQEDDT